MATKKKRRNTLLHGEGVEHLTVHHYTEGWKLYASRCTGGQICRTININQRQLAHLVKEGLPARGRRAALPSYESLALKEMAAAQEAGAQAGTLISLKGVAVLGQQIETAQCAGDIVSMLAQHQRERVAAEMARPVMERDFDKAALPESMLAVMRTMRPYADLRGPTQAFRNMYDAHPAQRQELPTEMIDVEVQPRLPAALAFMEEISGDGSAQVFVGELTKLIEHWTEEEKLHYAKTGEEPTG
jgi:hypothetical protein